MTLLVIPINVMIMVTMLILQKRFMRYADLKFRHNIMGIVLYVTVYQILMSPVCVVGYFQEIFNAKKKW